MWMAGISPAMTGMEQLFRGVALALVSAKFWR